MTTQMIMTGSTKQVAWAEIIRGDYLDRLAAAANSDDVTVAIMNHHLLEVARRQSSTDAKAWIDNRDQIGPVDLSAFNRLRTTAMAGTDELAKVIMLYHTFALYNVVYGVAPMDRAAATAAAEDLIHAIAATRTARLAQRQDA